MRQKVWNPQAVGSILSSIYENLIKKKKTNFISFSLIYQGQEASCLHIHRRKGQCIGPNEIITAE